MSPDELHTPNILLNSLEAADRDRLAPLLSRCELEKNMTLGKLGEPITRCHFVEHGIVSTVAIDDNSRTEVGLTGREGVTATHALLGDDLSPFESFVQVDGGTALAIGTDDLRDAMEDSATLRRAMLLYANTFMVQLAFGVVAYAQHLMEARLARWLLMCHDRVEEDEVPITHEFLAMMISAQRSGITMSLHSLEGAGMVRSTRGLVTIRDRAKLEELAGHSYGVAERRYSALIAPFGKSG